VVQNKNIYFEENQMVVLDFGKSKCPKPMILKNSKEENFKNKKPSLEGSFSKIKHLQF
jgi:hypothetical protein